MGFTGKWLPGGKMGYDFDDFIEDLRAMKDKKEPMKTKRVEIEVGYTNFDGRIGFNVAPHELEKFQSMPSHGDGTFILEIPPPEPTVKVTPSRIREILKDAWRAPSRYVGSEIDFDDKVIEKLFGEGWDK